MDLDFFVTPELHQFPENGQVSWESPSNIALVKYWGKVKNREDSLKDIGSENNFAISTQASQTYSLNEALKDQIPANPSISFTLSNCKTTTTLTFEKLEVENEEIEFELFFEGERKESFYPKITSFFKRILPFCTYLKHYKFSLETSNTFPHSSGIASSASGMSALALCIMSLEKTITGKMDNDYFFQKASFLARLGSGSACRSIEGPMVVWGEHPEIPNSSNLYGTTFPFKIHTDFLDFQDTILLIHTGEKEVSSSVGHDLLIDHPYAEARFQQANNNLSKLSQVLQNGNMEEFIAIVESEALSLHAMMLSSSPYFILIKPNTLEVINEIWEFRRETKIPVCFTLDAGANVHVLYPKKYFEEVDAFIKTSLSIYCANGHYICDDVGAGAKLL